MIETFLSRSEDETIAAGRRLSAQLEAGSVVLLVGELGAGKTAFVRGLAEGLDVSSDQVNSPTFTILQEYRGGRLPLFHADLYRLNDAREVEDLGLEEIGAGGVLAIEWADRLDFMPPDAVRVTIDHTGEDERRIRVEVT